MARASHSGGTKGNPVNVQDVRRIADGNFVGYPTQKAMQYAKATPKRDSTGIAKGMMSTHVPQDRNSHPGRVNRR